MGWRGTDYEIQASSTEESVSLDLTLGALVAVGAHLAVPVDYPNAIYCTLCILSEASTFLGTRMPLFSGYLLPRTPLGWSGAIPISGQDTLLWTFFGPAASKIRCWSYTINPEIASSGVPRDP